MLPCIPWIPKPPHMVVDKTTQIFVGTMVYMECAHLQHLIVFAESRQEHGKSNMQN